jgi:hypothetical protein
MEVVGGVQEMMWWWWWWCVHSITRRGGGFGPKPENRADGARFRVHRWERTAGAMEGVGCGGGGGGGGGGHLDCSQGRRVWVKARKPSRWDSVSGAPVGTDNEGNGGGWWGVGNEVVVVIVGRALERVQV